MAEIVGLVASVASLIALTSETSKACNKLARSVSCFANASADVQKIGAELLELAHILELLQSVLQPLHDCEAEEQEHLDFIERSIARLRNDVRKIADSLISLQSKARGSNTKGRAKWIYMKDDVASMMAIIDRQKQTLLRQLNLLNLKIAHRGATDCKDFRKDMRQVETRFEDLTAFLRTSTSESAFRIEDRIQSSVTSLESLIRDEIHRTISSIPRESYISRASLETLSVLVSEILASRSESLASGNLSNYPERLPSTERESIQRMADGSQTDSVHYATGGSQATVGGLRSEGSDYLNREGASSTLNARTSVQRMTSFFGTVVIRRSAVKVTFSSFDPEFVSERAKVEIDFIPATWLRSWAGCGMFLARMGFGKPKFDFSFAVARIVNQRSDPQARRTLDAVINGDLDTLKELLQLKATYPTDRNQLGQSLLTIAASRGHLDICELLLQQGAALDINTPTFHTKSYPIQQAVAISMKTNTRDFVRLFLKFDADVTMIDGFGHSVGVSALNTPQGWGVRTQETGRRNGFQKAGVMQSLKLTIRLSGSLFRSIVESDPSFDIHQRDWRGRTLLMQVKGQPRQTYEELVKLGADARASDGDGSTVLHHFFWNNLDATSLYPCPDLFLDSGEILALLIKAGADPQALNRFGKMPQDDIPSPLGINPLGTIRKWINLAFWHQALQICGLSGSRYCGCHAHHRKKIPWHDPSCPCQSCLGEFVGSLRLDTFEEEMSAALTRWDKNAGQHCYWSEDGWVWEYEERWNHIWDTWDAWFQEVSIELQIRQKKAILDAHADLKKSGGDRSKCVEEDNPEREETQSSNQICNVRSNLATQESDSDKRWRNSISTSSEDDWESAPET